MTHGVEMRLSERFAELGTEFGVPVLVLIRQGRVLRHQDADPAASAGATDARILARARVALLKGEQRVDPVNGGHLFLMPISSAGGDPLGAVGMVIPQELHGQGQEVPEAWLKLLVRYVELWVKSALGEDWAEYSEPLLEQAEGAAEQALAERLQAAERWSEPNGESGFELSLSPAPELPAENRNGHPRTVTLPPLADSGPEFEEAAAGPAPSGNDAPQEPVAAVDHEGGFAHRTVTLPPPEAESPPAEPEPPLVVGEPAALEPRPDVEAPRVVEPALGSGQLPAADVPPVAAQPAAEETPGAAAPPAMAPPPAAEMPPAELSAPSAVDEAATILVARPYQLVGANDAAVALLAPGYTRQRMLCFEFLGRSEPCQPCVAAAAELARATLSGRIDLAGKSFRVVASPLDDGADLRFMESFELLPEVAPEEPLPAPPWPPQYADLPEVVPPATEPRAAAEPPRVDSAATQPEAPPEPAVAPVDRALEAAFPEMAVAAGDSAAAGDAGAAGAPAEEPPPVAEPPLAEEPSLAEEPPPVAEPSPVDELPVAEEPPVTEEPALEPGADVDLGSVSGPEEDAATPRESLLSRLLLPGAVVVFVATAAATWFHLAQRQQAAVPTVAELVADAARPAPPQTTVDDAPTAEPIAAEAASSAEPAAAEAAPRTAAPVAAEAAPAAEVTTAAEAASPPVATAPPAAEATPPAPAATAGSAAATPAPVAPGPPIPFVDKAAYQVALEFIAHEDLAGAADAWGAMLEAEPKSNSTLMLETNCEDWAAAENLQRFHGDPAAILKPIYVEGRKCFLLAYGSFPDQAAAEAAIAQLPEPFRSRAKRPIIRSFNLLP